LGVWNEIRVLAALLRPLTHYHKFYVLCYNARGVGLSSGWKSFTGLQEAEDLRELVKCAVKRLNDVREVVLIVSIQLLPPLPPFVVPPETDLGLLKH
jgi:pimeloyl-ACP methyl ester carboxylesterase